MRVVLDSSVFIDILRGDQAAASVLRRHILDGDEIWGVVVSRAEILADMRSSEREPTERLLSEPRWLDVDLDLADEAGRLARHHRRSYPGVGVVDFIIAAGVQRLDARLLTKNVRHFPMLPDLAPAY